MNYLNSLLLSLCASYGIGCSDGGDSVTSTPPVPPPPVTGPPDPPPHPEYGTLLNSGCSKDYPGVKWFQYADGDGGTYSEKDQQSEECGWEPPVAGTLLNSGCSEDYPGVKWFQYADGEGGTYDEQDRYSTECGYSTTLTLSLDEEVGDRFYPVVVNVEYIDTLGEDQVWGMEDASTTIGYAERVNYNTVHIYGDGRLGDGIFTLGREEIQFRMEPEPTCDVQDRIDCQGYTQRTNESMIYYGEDDDFIVTWELAVLIYTRGDTVEIIDDAFESQWRNWESRVEKYNEVYERSGVHIRYELVELKQATFGTLGDLQYLRRQLDVDIVLGHGTSYSGTCGVAKVTKVFREGKPPVSLSRCDTYTDLHELGHSVGLAHGPENQYNEAVGYIFPEFGHGWNDICGDKDDLMSYGYQKNFHSNGKLNCSEITPGGAEAIAGGRQWTDTAYSLNRVRYEVALIHDENKYEEEYEALRYIIVEAERKQIEVID